MQEFIVWDDIKREFTNNVTCFMSFNEDGTINSYNGFGETKYFQYIGKKDTEGNKIYADSSIVEFIYQGEQIPVHGARVHHTISLVGFFTYDNEEARYEVDILNNSEYVCLNFDSLKFKDIKIIDTIQENKLGLIK